MATIHIDEQEYTFKISNQSYDIIESMIGGSLMVALQQNGGMIPLRTARVIYGNSLYNGEGNRIPYPQAEKIANQFIEEVGYQKAVVTIANQMQEDLPFLFR